MAPYQLLLSGGKVTKLVTVFGKCRKPASEKMIGHIFKRKINRFRAGCTSLSSFKSIIMLMYRTTETVLV